MSTLKVNTIRHTGASSDAVTFDSSGNTTVNQTLTTTSANITTGGTHSLTISDGDLVIGTAGHGIDFSAVSHHPDMTSETLSSYEEGTWTPNLQNVSAPSYNSRGGRYTKVGRWIYCTGILNIASGLDTSDASTVNIGGLPFTGNSDHEVVLFTLGRYVDLFSQSTLESYTNCRFTGTGALLMKSVTDSGILYSDCNSSGRLQFAIGYQL